MYIEIRRAGKHTETVRWREGESFEEFQLRAVDKIISYPSFPIFEKWDIVRIKGKVIVLVTEETKASGFTKGAAIAEGGIVDKVGYDTEYELGPIKKWDLHDGEKIGQVTGLYD